MYNASVPICDQIHAIKFSAGVRVVFDRNITDPECRSDVSILRKAAKTENSPVGYFAIGSRNVFQG